jgi:hypothetical protein
MLIVPGRLQTPDRQSSDMIIFQPVDSVNITDSECSPHPIIARPLP